MLNVSTECEEFYTDICILYSAEDETIFRSGALHLLARPMLHATAVTQLKIMFVYNVID